MRHNACSQDCKVNRDFERSTARIHEIFRQIVPFVSLGITKILSVVQETIARDSNCDFQPSETKSLS